MPRVASEDARSLRQGSVLAHAPAACSSLVQTSVSSLEAHWRFLCRTSIDAAPAVPAAISTTALTTLDARPGDGMTAGGLSIPLADLGDHVVGQADQVEPVGDHDRAWEGVGDRAQVGCGQVDAHVGDPGTPRIGLCADPLGDLGRGPPVDVSEEPAAAGGVDDAGVPPVVGHPPLPAVRVLLPLGLSAAGHIDPQHRHRRQRLRQGGDHVDGVRPVGHRPGHPVVVRTGLHAGEPLRDPGAALGPQPGRQPRAGRDRGDRLGERPSRAQGLATAPPPLVPHQPDQVRPVRKVPRPSDGVTLHRRGEHPTLRTPRGALVVGGDIHDPVAAQLERHRGDSEPLDTQQQRRPSLPILTLNLRTLNQARDLTLVTMNCSTQP